MPQQWKFATFIPKIANSALIRWSTWSPQEKASHIRGSTSLHVIVAVVAGLSHYGTSMEALFCIADDVFSYQTASEKIIIHCQAFSCGCCTIIPDKKFNKMFVYFRSFWGPTPLQWDCFFLFWYWQTLWTKRIGI